MVHDNSFSTSSFKPNPCLAKTRRGALADDGRDFPSLAGASPGAGAFRSPGMATAATSTLRHARNADLAASFAGAQVIVEVNMFGGLALPRGIEPLFQP
jgi:hypothetical protein